MRVAAISPSQTERETPRASWSELGSSAPTGSRSAARRPRHLDLPHRPEGALALVGQVHAFERRSQLGIEADRRSLATAPGEWYWSESSQVPGARSSSCRASPGASNGDVCSSRRRGRRRAPAGVVASEPCRGRRGCAVQDRARRSALLEGLAGADAAAHLPEDVVAVAGDLAGLRRRRRLVGGGGRDHVAETVEGVGADRVEVQRQALLPDSSPPAPSPPAAGSRRGCGRGCRAASRRRSGRRRGTACARPRPSRRAARAPRRARRSRPGRRGGRRRWRRRPRARRRRRARSRRCGTGPVSRTPQSPPSATSTTSGASTASAFAST